MYATPWSRGDLSPLDDTNQQDNGRQNQKNVDEPAHRVASDHPEEPQDERTRKNCPEHSDSFPSGWKQCACVAPSGVAALKLAE
jgi:hypothetical protein